MRAFSGMFGRAFADAALGAVGYVTVRNNICTVKLRDKAQNIRDAVIPCPPGYATGSGVYSPLQSSRCTAFLPLHTGGYMAIRVVCPGESAPRGGQCYTKFRDRATRRDVIAEVMCRDDLGGGMADAAERARQREASTGTSRSPLPPPAGLTTVDGQQQQPSPFFRPAASFFRPRASLTTFAPRTTFAPQADPSRVLNQMKSQLKTKTAQSEKSKKEAAKTQTRAEVEAAKATQAAATANTARTAEATTRAVEAEARAAEAAAVAMAAATQMQAVGIELQQMREELAQAAATAAAAATTAEQVAAATVAAQAAAAVPTVSWFEQNKTLVIGSAVAGVLVIAGAIYMKK